MELEQMEGPTTVFLVGTVRLISAPHGRISISLMVEGQAPRQNIKRERSRKESEQHVRGGTRGQREGE